MKPTKGVKPQLDGVPGVFIAAADLPAGIIFGATGRKSPYDDLLRKLLDAGAGAVLCFGDRRARASLYARAKKLALKIEFGEHSDKLYVRLSAKDTASVPLPPVKEVVVSDMKTRKRSMILTAIRAGRKTPEAIAAWLRAESTFTEADAPITRSMLKAMQADGSVRLLKITPETWEVAV